MFLTTVKAWATTKMVPITIFIGSILIASLVAMSVLYKMKVKDYNLQVSNNATLVVEKQRVEQNLLELNKQIIEERKRHAELEAEQKKAYDDYIARTSALNEKKNDKVKKESVKKDPTKYKVESQNILNDYTNRMNCLSGNKTSCAKL